MNVAEKCLQCLSEKNWIELNDILSQEKNCRELSSHPSFAIFEKVLITEIEKYEQQGTDELLIPVVTRIFQVSHVSQSLSLSTDCKEQLVSYLFLRTPNEQYAKLLPNNQDAKRFIQNIELQRNEVVNNAILASSFDIKIGAAGKLDFSKSIFNNSTQEKELYLIAKKLLKRDILLPNTALSTIIDSKITGLLNSKTANYFYKSTLDLCIVHPETFIPKFFIELDSAWHDRPKQIENDKMKDEIFETSGFTLHRLRKTQGRSMLHEFELFLREYYVN